MADALRTEADLLDWSVHSPTLVVPPKDPLKVTREFLYHPLRPFRRRARQGGTPPKVSPNPVTYDKWHVTAKAKMGTL